MTQIHIGSTEVTITFTRLEKILGLVRDLTLPRDAVRSAHLVESWREVRGLRIGLGVPRYRLVGRWVLRGPRQLVSLKRGVPAVRLVLEGSSYGEALLSVPDADDVVRRLGG